MSDLSKLSDEEVVEITRTKNKEAYSEVVRRYQEKLMRYARYLVKDEARAADVVQDAFIKAFIKLNSFDTKRQFSSWIYRIVHNEAINLINKYKKEQPLLEDFDFESNVNVEEEYTKKEVKKMVKDCLEEIPLLYREPLSLYFLEEKSYVEISDILRIPTGTVGTRINRAKLVMRKKCQLKKIK
ncbi:MAG: RNA polymerase sigma factor [Candidatus Pacebacteria bacterium]|jgi:RNA polymerase sigma-70 factor, ECF subfamily|nr:RNA polymerase sigma factor [Candidatus Paceibacterota bacterium]MBT3511597.1 RNA polymerase sigma factor [Candidatus Paceibacterota bacterium]MBT4004933.1 RNA polymerase sigma factor [Candidatus Paceibacterota bacterium]MBT4358869.1 RNA polymerase sigma factor [Candidatus Paceibacterota bacterium]MBT4680676.1 RNA polymerase sigma factor [Candidatus Paceibacterota bacterium]